MIYEGVKTTLHISTIFRKSSNKNFPHSERYIRISQLTKAKNILNVFGCEHTITYKWIYVAPVPPYLNINRPPPHNRKATKHFIHTKYVISIQYLYIYNIHTYTCTTHTQKSKCVELFMADGMFSFVSCFNQKEVPIFPYFLRNIVTIHILQSHIYSAIYLYGLLLLIEWKIILFNVIMDYSSSYTWVVLRKTV